MRIREVACLHCVCQGTGIYLFACSPFWIGAPSVYTHRATFMQYISLQRGRLSFVGIVRFPLFWLGGYFIFSEDTESLISVVYFMRGHKIIL